MAGLSYNWVICDDAIQFVASPLECTETTPRYVDPDDPRSGLNRFQLFSLRTLPVMYNHGIHSVFVVDARLPTCEG